MRGSSRPAQNDTDWHRMDAQSIFCNLKYRAHFLRLYRRSDDCCLRKLKEDALRYRIEPACQAVHPARSHRPNPEPCAIRPAAHLRPRTFVAGRLF